ncbi:MAG: hypothetical protein ACFE7R_03495 [Candidatus Hodarchaeota archaeon]
MVLSINHLSKKIADSYKGYILGFVVGIVLFLIMLSRSNFSIQTMYMNEFAIWFLSISGVVMKFLSGLGVMLTYASVCAFVFRSSASQVKGSRKRLKVLKAVLIIPILAILAYALYTLVRALTYSQNLTLIENLTAIYGVWSLMFLVYIVPIVLGEYNPKLPMGTLEGVAERASSLKHSIWKGYQSYVWRDYGKVYSAEFERYHERMSKIRAVLSGFLLWPIAMVLMLFPPLGIVSVVLWFRIFSLDYKPFSDLERLLLMGIVTVVLLVTTYLFLAIGFPSLMIYFDLSYAIGIFFSLVLLGIVILRS